MTWCEIADLKLMYLIGHLKVHFMRKFNPFTEFSFLDKARMRSQLQVLKPLSENFY